MNIKIIQCEYYVPDRCKSPAAWQIGVGDRVYDRQYSCTRHLNRTCQAMVEAEKPRRYIVLTVTPVVVRQWRKN